MGVHQKPVYYYDAELCQYFKVDILYIKLRIYDPEKA